MKATEIVTADRIETSPECLAIYIGEGRFQIPWSECSSLLAEASESERLNAELSPGGYGIHWPAIDEDLSIGGLLGRLLPDGS